MRSKNADREVVSRMADWRAPARPNPPTPSLTYSQRRRWVRRAKLVAYEVLVLGAACVAIYFMTRGMPA